MGSGFMLVILFVSWNLPLNFLFPFNEIKHPGQMSPSLIIFPLKHSQVQFISKTMYRVSTLPHAVLVDKGRKWYGSLLSRSSVASVETNAYSYFSVHIRTGELRRWSPRLRKPKSQKRYPEGGYTLMHQKI